MLFKQRKKIDFIARILNFFWPRNGWGRLFKYTTLRIKRLPGSPHSIALGFTFGVIAAMTPLFGLHFIILLNVLDTTYRFLNLRLLLSTHKT